jgi:hypothetical protein
MRAATIILVGLCLLAGSGCVTGVETRPWQQASASLGISEEDVANIAHQATKSHKLFIAWFQRRDDGGIDVYMRDTPNRAHGIVVVFRKIDGRWHEDPKSQSEWIV